MRAKKISARIAAARDLDVFLDEFFEPAAAPTARQDAFAVLRSRAQAARRRAWDDAVSHVMSPAFSGFMNDLSRLWIVAAGAKAPTARPMPPKA